MRFVQKTGVWSVATGGRSGTPVLKMPNLTQGNVAKVTVTFLAKTAGQANSGFDYSVEATNSADVQVLSAQESIVQSNVGWQTTTKTVLFLAQVRSETGVEDVDFQVVFSAGDLDGEGQVSNFLMIGEVVTLDQP